MLTASALGPGTDWNAFTTKPIDLGWIAPKSISLDLRKLDGFAVIEQLRAHDATRPTPVVILSNLFEAHLHERGRRVGVLDFLIKS
jgi:CheY-like chemotaxis protein